MPIATPFAISPCFKSYSYLITSSLQKNPLPTSLVYFPLPSSRFYSTPYSNLFGLAHKLYTSLSTLPYSIPLSPLIPRLSFQLSSLSTPLQNQPSWTQSNLQRCLHLLHTSKKYKFYHLCKYRYTCHCHTSTCMTSS